MAPIDWYFDFISPYAWLQAEALQRDAPALALACKPVLFAGLLDHWGQLGPAEVTPKRRFTYRHIVWRAKQLGLEVKLPSAHPFNPLRLLRLAIVLDADPALVLRLFRFVWSEGRRPDDADDWAALTAELDVIDAQARISAPEVKEALRRNGEEALARGVFGVPTLAIDGELFWGVDATEMALAYARGDALFTSGEMLRASDLPVGVSRRGSRLA